MTLYCLIQFLNIGILYTVYIQVSYVGHLKCNICVISSLTNSLKILDDTYEVQLSGVILEFIDIDQMLAYISISQFFIHTRFLLSYSYSLLTSRSFNL